jgi:hypothetical protein
MRLWNRKTKTLTGQTAIEAIAGKATTDRRPVVLAVDEFQELFSRRPRPGRWARAGTWLGQVIGDNLSWLYQWLGMFADRCVQYGPVLWGAAAGAAGAWWADGHPIRQVAAMLWSLAGLVAFGLLLLAFLDMVHQYAADSPSRLDGDPDDDFVLLGLAEVRDAVRDMAHDVAQDTARLVTITHDIHDTIEATSKAGEQR